MNFQDSSTTVSGMAKQQEVYDLGQKEIQVCIKEMEKIN